jgi:putative glutamine amidotransferase
MPAPLFSPRIGIYGLDESANQPSRGCNLWCAGYSASVTEAGGVPIDLTIPDADSTWDDLVADLDGIVLLGFASTTGRQASQEELLCRWCQEREMPVLGVDFGLQALNAAFGGATCLDIPREMPQALQHRHPAEPGVRHAILVEPGTRLANIYGEGEIVVNSEHARAISRVARGFRVSGRALDGVIEAIEPESEAWFALGVQWHPASTTASGLDIQVFRGLVDACRERRKQALPVGLQAAA